MEGNYIEMLSGLKERTATISANESDAIKAITNCIQLVNSTLTKLHVFMDDHPFSNQEDQLRFFKTIRPQLDGMRLFYMQILHIEMRAKSSSTPEKIQIYRRFQNKVASFFDRNAEFYRYHLLSLSYLDQYYFLPATEGNGNGVDDDAPLYCDHRYYARMSYKAAQLHAYQLLSDYLERQIILRSPVAPGGKPPKEILHWTASKAALGELLYALQEYGVFNNTKIEISKIADYLEKVFDTDLKNIYKMYEDMRLRKKSRTPFLDALRNGLIRRMEHDDENAP